MYGEDFPLVFLPGAHGEVVEADVEQLDGAVAGGYNRLVLVRLGPRDVEERVLRVEPACGRVK